RAGRGRCRGERPCTCTRRGRGRAGVGRRLPYRSSRPGHDRYPALPLAECGARNHMNDPNIGRIVVDEHELQQRIRDLGKEIAADYDDHPPLLVGILKGAFMFMADLARAIDLPVEFDFMAVSSYGSATRTSGVVRIMKDLDLDLTDRHVLI